MKIFQPQNEKGQNLVPLIKGTEKIDNKYLDIESLSEQLTNDGSIKIELDSLDKRVEAIEDTLDDEVDTHIKNSAIHFELEDSVENQSTKAVTGKAVIDYVESQDFADAEKINEFESALQDLQGEIDEIDPNKNLEKLATFFGEEDIEEGDNTLKDITDTIDGLTATNHPVQQVIQTDEPESTYAVSSKAVIGAIEDHADDSSLHLINNQAELIEGFFANRQPDGSIEEGETLDDILNKLDKHDSDIERLSNVDNDLIKIKDDLYGSDEVDIEIPLIADGTFNDSDNIIHLSQFNLKSIARSNVPNKFKSIVIHDVQNSWNNSTNPIEAEVRFGIDQNNLKKKIVKALPVEGWTEGNDLEFELTEVVDAITAGYDTFQFVIVDTTSSNQQENVPHVKYDNTKNISQWYGSCDLGVSNPWTAAQSSYAINVSFKVTRATIIGHLDNTDIHTSLAEKAVIAENFAEINNKLDTLYPVYDGEEIIDTDKPVSGHTVWNELNEIKAGQSVANTIDEDNETNPVSGKAVADYVTTQINDIDVTLPDNIQCKSIEVTGNYINYLGGTVSNLDLGNNATISGGWQNGNIILGSSSTISNGTQYGNINLGSTSTISGGTQEGNVNLGQSATISNGEQWGNVNLGCGSRISGGIQKGNVFAGSAFQIDGNCYTTYNTWIIASLASGGNIDVQVTKRYGLTLIGNADECALPNPENSHWRPSYRVYWPNVSGYDAQIHGNTQWMSDHNIKDTYGNYIVQNGQFVGGSNITIDNSVTSSSTNAVTSKAIFNFVTTKVNEKVSIDEFGRTIAGLSDPESGLREAITEEITSAVSGHASNTSLHFDGEEKENLTAILNNYDGTTSIKKLVDDIDELKNTEVTLPDNIECKSLEVKGNSIDWSSDAYGNLDLGSYATISAGDQTGNVTLGYGSAISGGQQNGNIIAGDGLMIYGGYQYGNVISGIDTNIYGAVTATKNTWIIASIWAMRADFKNQVTNRYGLTLIGTGEYTPSVSNKYRYRVYWPNSDAIAAEQHGSLKCMVDFNLLDKDGNHIIQNGEFVAASDVTVDSEVSPTSDNAVSGKAVSTYVSGQNFVKSLNAKEIRVYTDPDSAPPLEEREDGVLYLCKTTTEQKDYSSEIDELKQQIQALTEQLATYATQSYVNDNFIRGKVVDSQDKVEDKGDDYTYIIKSNK